MTEQQAPASGICIRNLYKIFGAHAADYIEHVRQGLTKAELNARYSLVLGLKNINLDIPAGGIFVIMGLSGSGKSTLIRHINRLIDPTAGDILVDGVNIMKMNAAELREYRRRKTAMVFQKFGLLPHRTVLDNAVYGLEVQGLPRARQVEAAMFWIERVGLKGFEVRYPHQLSGGMQQRVGLARALTNDAPILLMDEAFSALDPLIRVDMQSVLLGLQREIRKTIVFITHDLDEALRLGDRIAILGDGEVIQEGTSQDIILKPQNEYISKFTREVNRARVLRVETIMDAGQIRQRDGVIAVAAGTNLEAAARQIIAEGANAAHVTDANGVVVGSVDLTMITAAIVNPVSAGSQRQ